MADARAVFDVKGIDSVVLTFAYDSSITFDKTQNGNSAAAAAGLAVTLTGDHQVGLTQDADAVLGQLLRVDFDGFCSVQVQGGVYLPAGNAATVTAGSRIVGALGPSSARGYIRNVAAATLAEVAKGAHKIMDASVSTAVQVVLGL